MFKQYHGNFQHLSFPKTGKEIKEKVAGMIEARIQKISDREGRIKQLVEKKGVTATDFFANLHEFESPSYQNTYSFQAGELANLKAEALAIKENREELDRLKLIHRNLPDSDTFKLDFAELDYFGF